MKILFFANTDWYLFNFRLGLAEFLRDKGCEVVMLSPPGEYGPRFAEIGFRWIALPMQRRSLNPVRELNLLRLIRKIYSDEQPDLIHNFTIKCVVYGSLAAQSAGIAKRINAVTGLGHVFINSSLKARMLRPVVKQLLRTALQGKKSYLILQNKDDQQLFAQRNLINKNHVTVIKGSGVDSDYFSPTGHERCHQFKILLASRLLREKGIQTFVDAAKLLAAENEAIQFLLAGASDPGNPSAITENELAAWKRQGNIKILGHVDNIRQLMQTVDLVVLPSHREGVPRGLLEAASMELPIIATDVPGCREIVENGRNGFLIPVNDAPALAAKIAELFADPVLCRKFGREGRLKVRNEFEQKLVFEQTVHVYRAAGLSL
jgi:glycosyltransferase involved in cell wall biosynthesis